MEGEMMKFKQNALISKMCCIGAIVYSILTLIFAVLISMSENIQDSLLVLFKIAGSLMVCIIVVMICFAIEYASEVIISPEGVLLNSRFHGAKMIKWGDCHSIGILGYNYGSNGTLVFSREKQIYSSQRDCCQSVRKDKSAILVNYTPQLFDAVQRFAPRCLLSQCNHLMEPR